MKKTPKTFYEYLNPDFGYFYTYTGVIAEKKTKFQNLKLVNTKEFGKVLLLDGITQVGEKNEFLYHEPMTHLNLLGIDNPQNILVIGGGDGGIVREVLRHSAVRRIDHVDIDGDVFVFSKKYLPTVAGSAFTSKKTIQIAADGRAWVREHPGLYDGVIMDMTDPFGPSRMLYTKEFFAMVKKSFRNPAKGMFTMHSESPISRPNTFVDILATLKKSFKYVTPYYIYIQMYAVLWSIAVCSDNPIMSKISADEVEKRLKQRRIKNLEVINGETVRAMRAEFPYIQKLRKQKGKVISDTDPDVRDIIIKFSK